MKPKIEAVFWSEGQLRLLDQTLLPGVETYRECQSSEQVAEAIRVLAVRGAPAIGVAAAYGVLLAHSEAAGKSAGDRSETWRAAIANLKGARPTAVNLAWAVDRMVGVWSNSGSDFGSEGYTKLSEEAAAIHAEDVAANRTTAQLGAELIGDGVRLLTHCNTGDLATSGVGTAFGVLRCAHEKGKVDHVYACEARPVLQGLRLTAWELEKNGIPFSVICDSMAGSVMKEKGINAVFLGADRIAANGDVANKVGTYNLAVLARHHGIPFYVVAPTSTFDLSLEGGAQIPIEVRDGGEILDALGDRRGAAAFPVYNPAFDRTPADLITAIICEKGVIKSPSATSINAVLGNPSSLPPIDTPSGVR